MAYGHGAYSEAPYSATPPAGPPPVVKTASAAFVGRATLAAVAVVVPAAGGIAAGRTGRVLRATGLREPAPLPIWAFVRSPVLEVPDAPRVRLRVGTAPPVAVLGGVALTAPDAARPPLAPWSEADPEELELVAALAAAGAFDP